MRSISIIIGLTLLYGTVNTYEKEELDKANEWVSNSIDETLINDRIAEEPISQDECDTIMWVQNITKINNVTISHHNISKSQPPSQGVKICAFSNERNGTCVKKELCLDSSQFILRDRDSCTASEICCLKIKVDSSNNVTTKKPTDPVRCTTHQQKEGICVQISCCSTTAQIIDPRFIYRERGTCPHLEACCLESNVISKPIKPLTPNIPNGCGWSNPGANIFRSKNSNSGVADYGEFPWMVALHKEIETELSKFLKLCDDVKETLSLSLIDSI